MTAIKMIELPIKTPERTIYGNSEINIPGLHLFGHYIVPNASESILHHYHENVIEFTVAVKGALTWETQASRYTFRGGDVFISYPEEPHSGAQTPFGVSEIYWFQLDPTVTDSFLFLCPEAAEHIILQLQSMSKHIIHADGNIIHPLFKQIFALLENNGDRYLIATHMLLLIQHLIADYSDERSLLTPDIDRTINYILENITSEYSIEELAEIANLSSSHFQQKFKKQVGIGPRHFINGKKIEYSKKLLLEGSSVTDTAMILGYNTSSYFSTVFKKYAFYTPSEFLELEHKKKKEIPENKPKSLS